MHHPICETCGKSHSPEWICWGSCDTCYDRHPRGQCPTAAISRMWAMSPPSAPIYPQQTQQSHDWHVSSLGHQDVPPAQMIQQLQPMHAQPYQADQQNTLPYQNTYQLQPIREPQVLPFSQQHALSDEIVQHIRQMQGQVFLLDQQQVPPAPPTPQQLFQQFLIEQSPQLFEQFQQWYQKLPLERQQPWVMAPEYQVQPDQQGVVMPIPIPQAQLPDDVEAVHEDAFFHQIPNHQLQQEAAIPVAGGKHMVPPVTSPMPQHQFLKNAGFEDQVSIPQPTSPIQQQVPVPSIEEMQILPPVVTTMPQHQLPMNQRSSDQDTAFYRDPPAKVQQQAPIPTIEEREVLSPVTSGPSAHQEQSNPSSTISSLRLKNSSSPNSDHKNNGGKRKRHHRGNRG